jgi:hypothetical protein
MTPDNQQQRVDKAVEHAAAQLYAFAACAGWLAAEAALLADDGQRAVQLGTGRSGSGGHASPVEKTAHTAEGAIAVRIDACLAGFTAVIRDLERLDRERWKLLQACTPADRRLVEVHVTVPHCGACKQPAKGRLRAGYGDCCYQAWRRWDKTADPGGDRFRFERHRQQLAEGRAAA